MNRSSLFAVILALPASTASASLFYEVTDLGTLGGRNSAAMDINGSGQIVGYANAVLPADFNRGFRTTATGPMIDIGNLGSATTIAASINDAGQIAGLSYLSTGKQHAFITDANGANMTDLGTLAAGTKSGATGINSSGRVVGNSYINGETGNVHAFITDANGANMTDLGTLPGHLSSYAQAINDSGQVVGKSSATSSGSGRAFRTDAGGTNMTDLGTLGGGSSEAYDINASGQVVGWSTTAGNVDARAFRTNAAGTVMTNLGGIAGYLGSEAYGINDAGDVVGDAFNIQIPSGLKITTAFLYTDATGLVDLNELIPAGSGWMLSSARSINNKGQIVGFGTIGGEQHAFLLTPGVPEPAFLSVGPLFAAAITTRRRQRTKAH